VIVLVLLAVALIASQVAWPMIQRSHWMRHEPAGANPAVPVATPAPQAVAGNSNLAPAMPETGIDVSAARASAARLTASPQRDPFQSEVLSTNQAKPYPPASEVLSFTSFWRQTGSTLAVINNQVVAAGDSILAFKVESIDHDRVWVTGPNGREAVEFGRTHASSQSGPPDGARRDSTPPARPEN